MSISSADCEFDYNRSGSAAFFKANKKDYYDFHSECDTGDDYEACRWRICTTHTFTVTTPARTQQRTAPQRVDRPPTTSSRTNTTRTTLTQRTASTQQTTSTQRATPIQRTSPTATRVNRPVMGAGTGARATAPSTARVSAVSTATRTPIMTAAPTTQTQPRLREVAQLRKENVQLSRSLEAKTTQLRSASQQIGILKANVQELNNQLEVSRQRNRICQRKLDYAYKSHEKDGDRLKELTEGHTILKEELSRSKAMLDGFKVFMEQQQKQLIELKHAGDLKTSELTETQTALMDKMELRHRQQHQRSQERIEQLEQANMECNAKAVKYYTILQELKAYMKDQLIYSEAFKETKDNNTSSAVQNQTAGNRISNQEAAVHDRQAYIGYDLIASFKIHASILQMKLQNFEYKIEAQRKQLERISSGHDKALN